MILISILGQTPRYSITGMECRKMRRLTLNLLALVMVLILRLVSLFMVWNFMPNLSLTLTLYLGASPYLTLQRGLGALVILHLPSQRWNPHLMYLLGLELASL